MSARPLRLVQHAAFKTKSDKEKTNMNLDTVTKIAFPTAAKFSEFYDRWNKSLVNALSGKFSRADREDAVHHAFMKLMFDKEAACYERVPETERDWYGNFLWQARAYLSHLAEAKETWDGYHKLAYDEGYLTSGTGTYCTIDDEVEMKSVWETLYTLCKEAKMKDELVEACVRWWLNDEPSDLIESETGIKANYLYQIRFRITKLLEKKGPAKFKELQRKNFMLAA